MSYSFFRVLDTQVSVSENFYRSLCHNTWPRLRPYAKAYAALMRLQFWMLMCLWHKHVETQVLGSRPKARHVTKRRSTTSNPHGHGRIHERESINNLLHTLHGSAQENGDDMLVLPGDFGARENRQGRQTSWESIWALPNLVICSHGQTLRATQKGIRLFYPELQHLVELQDPVANSLSWN